MLIVIIIVVTITLALAHFNIHASACVSAASASAYISAASAHISKLPPRENVVLNTMMQHSQLQATSGNQSDGSSDISASHVKLINSECCSCDVVIWCNGMHIKCNARGCRFDPGRWQ